MAGAACRPTARPCALAPQMLARRTTLLRRLELLRECDNAVLRSPAPRAALARRPFFPACGAGA